jgi:hypothetical protein
MRTLVASLQSSMLVVFALAASGCNSGMHPVSGVVKLADGTPATALSGEEITFTSTDRPVMARAEIGPDGRFNAYTNRPGDGMAPGTYKVAISWTDDPVVRKGKGKNRAPFDPSMTDAEKSEVTVTINPGTNDLEITLPPPKQR